MQTASIEDMDLWFTALSSKWSQSMVSYFDKNHCSSFENTGKKGVGKPCKVTFKDLDNSNASNNDPQSNKNKASNDKVQNKKRLTNLS